MKVTRKLDRNYTEMSEQVREYLHYIPAPTNEGNDT